MVRKAEEIYKEHGIKSCSGTGCSLDEYRMCLMRGMPKGIEAQTKPIDFEQLNNSAKILKVQREPL
jgi:hypothetical protein